MTSESITTLMVFVISILFVFRPVFIPSTPYTPRIPINLTTAPILAIALLWAAQCLDPAVIRNGIVGTESVKPYNILILFFSLAYMAITLDITGILQAIAFWVSNRGGRNGWKLYLGVYVMSTLLSIVLGNDSIIYFGAAYLVHYTAVANLNPTPWIVAGFAAANTASMVLFGGNPVNVVICESFGINKAVFTAYTILPFLSCNVICFTVLAFQYRHNIPPRLSRIDHRDPRLALLDPVGACVGIFTLGATLFTCLIVSFFGIDDWKVSFPFAVAKFLFDVAWDNYRYSHGVPMLGRGPPKVMGQACDQPSSWNVSHRARADTRRSLRTPLNEGTVIESPAEPPTIESRAEWASQTPSTGRHGILCIFKRPLSSLDNLHDRLDRHFPTSVNTLPRLPFNLILFVFSQFILIEALDRHGWVDLFACWFVRASGKQMHPAIWLIGVLCIILCHVSGTSIGSTILLAKIVHAAALPYNVNHGTAIALAVASNVGAVGLTFSVFPSGLLCRDVLAREGIHVSPKNAALGNLFPLLVVMIVGLAVVSAEMAVLF